MKKNILLFLVLFLFLSTFSYGQNVTITGSTDDRAIKSDGAKWDGDKEQRLGGNGGGYGGVYPFQLPALASGEVIVAANFKIYLNGTSYYKPEGNADMYGLPYRDDSPVDYNTDYFEGDFGTDGNATAIQDDFMLPNSPSGQYIETSTAGQANLIDYINAQYSAGAQGGDYIFIRLSLDYSNASSNHYWKIRSANESSNKPTLDLTIEDRSVTGVSIDQTGPITIAPGMTTNLTASISPSNATDQSVSWSSSNNSIASVSSEGVVTAGSTESPATITVTTNDGSYTDDIVIIVDCSAVSIPANFAAMKGDREVTLTWDAVDDANAYKIYFDTDQNGSYDNPITIANGEAESTVVTGLTNGTPYYFKIATIFGICESDPSSFVTATPSDIYEYTGPNVFISTVESGKNLGTGMHAERIEGQPENKEGFVSFIPLDFVINIEAPNAEDDNLDACLTFSYDPETLPEGMNIASLTLFRFDDIAQVWVKMDSYSDVENNTVTLCGIDEFSHWTLAGSVPESVPLKNWGLVLIFLAIAGVIAIRKF